MSAISLTVMAVGIPGFMLSKVLAPAFYARQDTKTPMRAAIWTVAINVLLTVAITWPLWHNKISGAHAGIAAASGIAGLFNAGLLWVYLRRAGLHQPQPGWGRYLLRMLVASMAMIAVVLAIRMWVGEWAAIGDWRLRVGWLLFAVGAGAVAYGLAQVALGLRPRHLRH